MPPITVNLSLLVVSHERFELPPNWLPGTLNWTDPTGPPGDVVVLVKFTVIVFSVKFSLKEQLYF